jgi:hypothetical protein
MPRYEITSPDGKRYEITAPDGASQDDVLAYAQKQFGQPADDIPTLPPVRAELPDPTDGMSGVDRFRAGMGKAFADTGRGIKQFGTEAARYFVEEELGMEAPGLRESLARQQAEIDAAAQRDAPLMRTGGGIAGNVAGYASTMLVPGGIAARGSAVGRAMLPTTISGNAAQGAALGIFQPVETGQTRAGNAAKGAAFGGGGAGAVKIAGAAGRATGAAGRYVRNALAGVAPSEALAGNALLRETGGLNALRQLMTPQPSPIPGVQRTLGQESLNPGVMALENTLRGQQASTFVPQEAANNLARVQTLQRIAGSDKMRTAAERARDRAASTARSEAMAAGDVDVSRTVSLLDDAIAGQQGRPAVQAGLSQVRNLLARETEDAPGLVTMTPESRIAVLENVRLTIGDMLSGKYGGENAAALKGSRELLAIRDSLNEEIGEQVPAFTQYLDVYRVGSVPINRMDMGSELLNSGAGPIPDAVTGAPILTPFKFARATQDLDSTAARATGFKKAKAADILTASDLQLITGIRDDLQRQAAVSTATGGGSQTNARGAIAQRVARNAVNALPWIGKYAEVLQTQANQGVQEKLAYLLANPARAREVLKALAPPERSALTLALTAMAAQGSRATAVAAGQQ